MSRRPPNELESRLHQAALASPKQVRDHILRIGSGRVWCALLMRWIAGAKCRKNEGHHTRPEGHTKCPQLSSECRPVQVAEGCKGKYIVPGGVEERTRCVSQLKCLPAVLFSHPVTSHRTKELTGEENLVLSHIKNSGSEGASESLAI